jgi:hypothetical protein
MRVLQLLALLIELLPGAQKTSSADAISGVAARYIFHAAEIGHRP